MVVEEMVVEEMVVEEMVVEGDALIARPDIQHMPLVTPGGHTQLTTLSFHLHGACSGECHWRGEQGRVRPHEWVGL